MKYALSLLLAIALAACASTQSQIEQGAPKSEQFTDAAEQPLKDLNLVRAKIPPILLLAQEAPYQIPLDRTCDGLAAEIRALDTALGADLDIPPSDDSPGLIERGTAFVGKEAVNAVRQTAADLVPFRSWVRRLSGAERHSRAVTSAIAAGSVRRAFLKGLGEAAQCAPPAAPIKIPQP